MRNGSGVAIPLTAGAELRAGIYASPDGALRELVLSLRSPGHHPQLLVLPARSLRDLRRALQDLEACEHTDDPPPPPRPRRRRPHRGRR